MHDVGATAYFITWSCYGQHLHGNDRGYVDRVNNAYGTPLPPPHRGLLLSDTKQLADEPLVLSDDLRAVVHATIRLHAEFRGWRVLALNVRTTHVHVVLRAGGYPPEKIMGEFKAWSSRKMRESGLLDGRMRVWTRHGSTRHIFRDIGLAQAIHYVEHEQ